MVLVVFDNSRKLTNEDFSLIESVKDKHCVAVLNKTDLESMVDINVLKEYFKYVVEISAKNNNGIEMLKSSLEEIFKLNDFDATSGIIANERQKQCVESAKDYLIKANEVLISGETYDAVTVLIDKAAERLLELSGEKATEAVVNDVFSRFCVGK